MIQMADDQFIVAQVDQVMQQRDGIAAAGNADEIATGWREVANKSLAFNQRATLLRLHQANVQRPTLNVQRSK